MDLPKEVPAGCKMAPSLPILYSEAEETARRNHTAAQSTPGVTRGRRARELSIETSIATARPAASETRHPREGVDLSATTTVAGLNWKGSGSGMTYKFKLSRRLASNYRNIVASGLVLLAVTACGASAPTSSTDPEPETKAVPGWLTVQLDTPNTDDGAIQLRVSGPAIDSIKAETRFDGFGVTSGSSANLVITGSISDGTVARFRVPDVGRAAQYSVSVQAVAQRSTYELRSVTGYAASVVR